METAPTKLGPDWERIEQDYRTGLLSLREIAALHQGTNHVAITRRAKREGWIRDLQGRIKARADELVTRQAVTPAVTAECRVSDREVIEANAERIAQVRGKHRADIARARSVALKLLAELEHQIDHQDLYERLAELLIEPVEGEGQSEAAKKRQRDRWQAFNRAMALGSRSSTMKQLGETLRIVIGLEREAYDIDRGRGSGAGDQANAQPSRPLTDAERASRVVSILERVRQRSEGGGGGGGAA